LGCRVASAQGLGHLQRVRLRQGEKTWAEDCDYAAVAYGLYPNSEMAALLGCRLEGAYVAVDEWQRTSQESIYCAGECTGIGGVDLSLAEGEIAGYSAAGRPKAAERIFARRAKAKAFANELNRAYALREELKKLSDGDTLVCRCEDVRYERLKRLSSFRAAKLHTRCGMGPCQARVCGPATEFLFGWKTDSIRQPIFPSRIGTLVMNEAISEEAAQSTL
jgi:D-hydroxyproline dehydrogenase subunit alpha